MPFAKEQNIGASFDIEGAKHVGSLGKRCLSVLNLTDIHYSRDRKNLSTILKRIKRLIEEANPDLITITGDIISFPGDLDKYLRDFCKFIDGFGLPWAPLLGNHEGFSEKERQAVGDLYSSGAYKNIIFVKNAPELGVGNYLINIKSGGKVVHSIFMVDSHSDKIYEDGVKDYDFVWEPQLKWYEKAAMALAEENGGEKVPSSCFLHIPTVEYELAWRLYRRGLADGENDNNEPVCCPKHKAKEGPYNNGFFRVAKDSGTKLFLCGHDHTNTASIRYEGVTLAYSFCTRQNRYCNGRSPMGTVVRYYADGSFELENYIWSMGKVKAVGNIGKLWALLRKLRGKK